MAEDWDKLEAECHKLEAKMKPFSSDGAAKLWKALQDRDKLLDQHEKVLEKAAIAAYEGGVKNKTVAEFLKDKGFADAKKLLDADRKHLVDEVKALTDYCVECDTGAKAGDKLIETVAKALKAAKVGSPAQRKVAKAREDLAEKVKDLNEAAPLRFKIDKYLTTFNAQYDKLIEHFLAAALKKTKETKDTSEIPVPLTAAKIKERLAEVSDLEKKIGKACKEALAEAADKDAKKAMKLLEGAQVQLSEMHKLYGAFGKLTTKFKSEIAASKDGDAIKKATAEIKKMADEALDNCIATKKSIEKTFARELTEEEKKEAEEDYLGLNKLFKA